jgi:protein tyrosine/serine phosphatase
VEGLPNLFRVTPDLYRSAQPEETGMVNADKMGIKTVLSLRVSNVDPELAQGTGLLLRQVPIYTWNISEDEIVSALRIIRDAPGPMLVHCRHGADRTGLVMAMYRMVFQGWSKEEAREEMLNGGYGFHSIWTNIPKLIDQTDIAALRAKVSAQG